MDCIKEIAEGTARVKGRLSKDVVGMCKLPELLRELFKEEAANYDGANALSSRYFKDIYWSLKLHLFVHCEPQIKRNQEELKRFGKEQGLTEEELEKFPDRGTWHEFAFDPGSKLVELISDISDTTATPKGSQRHAADVMEIAKVLFRSLGKSIFRPKVLAQVSHAQKWFVGSSIAVSHFLRPLVLYRRIFHFNSASLKKAIISFALVDTTNTQRQNWSSRAFYSSEYNKEKRPCQNCKRMFRNLVGFMTSEEQAEGNSEEVGTSSFLAACAEYCPVDQLLEDDPGNSTEDENQVAAFERNKERCSILFTEYDEIAKACLDAYKSKDEARMLQVYTEVRPKVHIFGLKPECNNQF